MLNFPKRASLPEAGKTSTTLVQEAALAAAVDQGNGGYTCNVQQYAWPGTTCFLHKCL